MPRQYRKRKEGKKIRDGVRLHHIFSSVASRTTSCLIDSLRRQRDREKSRDAIRKYGSCRRWRGRVSILTVWSRDTLSCCCCFFLSLSLSVFYGLFLFIHVYRNTVRASWKRNKKIKLHDILTKAPNERIIAITINCFFLPSLFLFFAITFNAERGFFSFWLFVVSLYYLCYHKATQGLTDRQRPFSSGAFLAESLRDWLDALE